MSDPLALVAWVHNAETVTYSFFASMLNMAAHVALTPESPARGGTLPIRYGTGGLVQARNTAIEVFLRTECDWLVWLDTDMGFEPDTVDRLIAAADPTDRPIVGALCYVNHEVERDGLGGYQTRSFPTVYRWAQQRDSGNTGFVTVADIPNVDLPEDGLIACDATGSACIAIHRGVFETIRGNWYGLIASNHDGAPPFSEDMSFMLRCAQHDIPVHVHTGIATSHLKPVWLSRWQHVSHEPRRAIVGA